MSSSRDSSPDWLRSFQVPSHSPLTLSSDSGSSRDGGSYNEDKNDDEGSSPKSSRFLKVTKSKRTTSETASPKVEEQTPSKRKNVDKRKNKEGNKEEKKTENESNINKLIDHKESIHSIWTLSSDSESFHDHSPKRENDIDQVETSQHQISGGESGDVVVLGNVGKSPSKKGSKEKSSPTQIDVEGHTPLKGKKVKAGAKGKSSGDLKVEEEETFEKPAEPNVSSARLSLMLSEKVHRTKALIECQGDSIDLSGDMGAVGRVIISDSPSGDQDMYLDLKGTIYKTSIVPCRTFCIVSFGQSEAKIDAIMNDFIQLKPQSNVYEAETMVEGTLDGFSFDSDEEADKMQKSTNQTDQNENAEKQADGKFKQKADKTSGAEKKRGRSTGGKTQTKIAKKKTPGSKKAKTKK